MVGALSRAHVSMDWFRSGTAAPVDLGVRGLALKLGTTLPFSKVSDFFWFLGARIDPGAANPSICSVITGLT